MDDVFSNSEVSQLIDTGNKWGFDGSLSSSFIASFVIILCSEIGDKTFFVAALLSAKHSSFWVWAGACVAMFSMTILSVSMGIALPTLLSREITAKIAAVMFIYFGVKLLKLAISGDEGGEEDELEEAAQEVNAANAKLNAIKTKNSRKNASNSIMSAWNSGLALPIVMQAATLCFTAEWGDRSQFATVALGSSKNPFGVTIGGCVGHALCSGIAVIGGRVLADRISERAMNALGGSFFLLFAVLSIFTNF